MMKDFVTESQETTEPDEIRLVSEWERETATVERTDPDEYYLVESRETRSHESSVPDEVNLFSERKTETTFTVEQTEPDE